MLLQLSLFSPSYPVSTGGGPRVTTAEQHPGVPNQTVDIRRRGPGAKSCSNEVAFSAFDYQLLCRETKQARIQGRTE